MSATNDDHKQTQLGYRGAVVGALGGLFTGTSVSAIANAASGIHPTIANSVDNPLTFVLVFAGLAIGYLQSRGQ